MKQTDKRPYEPPVVEVFELKTECILQQTSSKGLGTPDDLQGTPENPFANPEP